MYLLWIIKFFCIYIQKLLSHQFTWTCHTKSTPVWYSLMSTPVWYSVNYDNIHCSLQHINTFLHCTHSTPFVQMLQYKSKPNQNFVQKNFPATVHSQACCYKFYYDKANYYLIQWPTPSGIKILTNVCAVTHSHTCTFFVLKLLPVLTVNNFICTCILLYLSILFSRKHKNCSEVTKSKNEMYIFITGL